tara:strand:- start:2987 stop:3610 length:624 start_codon:yes stop_codon:yes gene_type:complete
MKKIIVIGSGGHARVVIDTLISLNFDIQGIIDVNFKNQKEKILNYPILGDFKKLNEFDIKKNLICIAIGDINIKQKYIDLILSYGFKTPTIIHPSAFVSKNSIIGQGVFVNAKSTINAEAKVDDHSLINSNSIVEHEVVIGKNCHICPGVKIAGRVKIGDNTFVGIGSNIINNINIGDNVIIGAGTVVIKDVKSNSKIVGNPGREIK